MATHGLTRRSPRPPDITVEQLQRRVRVARGEEPGDLVLRGGRVVNVFSGTVEAADVVMADGWIAGVGRFDWAAREVIDVNGKVIAPGLIDAHMHIESTLLMPPEFARVVVPHGTAAVIADPHEIANVLGVEGVEMMLHASEGLPLDCFFMAPSCVPASAYENAGATLGAEEISRIFEHDRVLGLAEMMNFPGVLAADGEVLSKIAAIQAEGGVVDGHCPGLLGRELMAYASVGIRSDHECTTVEEARERSALGMLVQVREGSMARNLDRFLPLIREGQLGGWCLCTDDIHPEDLVTGGHIDALVRRVVASGVDPIKTLRHASLVPARHYGLTGLGAVAPGYRAAIAVFDDLVGFRAALVIHNGVVVARDGSYLFSGTSASVATANTVHLGALERDAFELRISDAHQPVIGIVPDEIVTRREDRDVRVEDGRWAFDPDDDIAAIACIQRHEPSGRLGLGLVTGFGFAHHGAIGSSVGHDAHNLLVAGTNPDDMLACARSLETSGGGFVAVAGGRVLAELRLPVAGLMSTSSATEVIAGEKRVNEAAASLGCRLHSPFGTLSFLALSVIPSLRITDEGLFDVDSFALVS